MRTTPSARLPERLCLLNMAGRALVLDSISMHVHVKFINGPSSSQRSAFRARGQTSVWSDASKKAFCSGHRSLE